VITRQLSTLSLAKFHWLFLRLEKRLPPLFLGEEIPVWRTFVPNTQANTDLLEVNTPNCLILDEIDGAYSYQQTDNMLEATAAAEDTDEVAIRMGKDEDDLDDEDSDTDSDYNSIDAERDAQEDDDDEGKPYPSYDWSHFFRGYIDTSWVDSQEKFHRDSGHDRQKFNRQAMGIQAYLVPMAGRS
jgi:hypothetical protein